MAYRLYLRHEDCKREYSKHRKNTIERARVTFVLYNKTKKRRDLSNFCGMADKIFCDVLTSMNIIKDDDCFTIPEVNYRFGGLGEDKIRVLVEEVE